MRIIGTKMKVAGADNGGRISVEKASVKLNSELQIMK
jgi:hypothetical protein